MSHTITNTMEEKYIYLPFQAGDLIDVARRLQEGGPYAFTGSLNVGILEAITRLPFEIDLVRGEHKTWLIVGNEERVRCELASPDARVIIHNHPGGSRYPSSTDILRIQLMKSIYTKSLETTGVLTRSGYVEWNVINHKTEYQYWEKMPDYSRGPGEYFAYAKQHGVVFEEYSIEKVLEYF